MVGQFYQNQAMNFPCPNPLNCPGVELAVANLTAELPDVNVSFGYSFSRETSQLCETVSPSVEFCSFERPFNPPPPVIVFNTLQSCSKPCGNGNSSIYIVAAGSMMGLTQAEADAAALTLACQAAQLQCMGAPVVTFTNTAQSCSYTCPAGPQIYTTPAGTFSGLTQAEANALAYTFACTLAALLCGGGSPGTGGGGTGGGPSGLPGSGGGGGSSPPPGLVIYNNSPQTATATCGDLSFSFTTPGGTFRNPSLLAANASAMSYAQAQVALLAKCLSDLSPTHICAGSAYSALITQTGVGTAAQVNWDANGMPSGITFANGLFSGAPTSGGTYPIEVQALNAFTGVNVIRNYTLSVQQITTETLAAATEGSAYAQAVVATGTVGAESWAITGGTLPTGLSIHSSTGVISGTPTLPDETVEPVTFNFTVGVTSSGLQCTSDYSIEVTPEVETFAPMAWWKMEEASGNRVDIINALPLLPEEFSGASIVGAAGKISDGALFVKPLGIANCNLNTGITPGLTYTLGDGISVVGWMRRVTGATNTRLGMSLTLLANDEATVMGYMLFKHVVGFCEISVYSSANAGDFYSVANAAKPLGDWFFVELRYDPVTQFVSVKIDNVEIIASTLAVEFGTATKAQFYLYWSEFAAAADGQYDEVSIFSPILTAEQVASIYNGGAGTTWPLS